MAGFRGFLYIMYKMAAIRSLVGDIKAVAAVLDALPPRTLAIVEQERGPDVPRRPQDFCDRAELDGKNAMTTHFRRLAKHLIGKDKADEIKDDGGWLGG